MSNDHRDIALSDVKPFTFKSEEASLVVAPHKVLQWTDDSAGDPFLIYARMEITICSGHFLIPCAFHSNQLIHFGSDHKKRALAEGPIASSEDGTVRIATAPNGNECLVSIDVLFPADYERLKRPNRCHINVVFPAEQFIDAFCQWGKEFKSQMKC